MEHDDLRNQLIYAKVELGLNPPKVSAPSNSCAEIIPKRRN